MSLFVKFGSDFDCRKYLQSGWSFSERDIVWGNARRSVLTLPRPERRGDWLLSLSLKVFMPPSQRYQPVTISVNGSVVGAYVLRQREMLLEFLVSDGLLQRGDEAEIAFYHHSPLRPSDVLPPSQDKRLLSIALVELELYCITDSQQGMQAPESMLDADHHLATVLRKEREADARHVNDALRTEGPDAKSLPMMIESYVRGVGATMQIRGRLIREIGQQATAAAGGEATEAFYRNGHIRPDFVRVHAEPFARLLFSERPAAALDTQELLPAGANELCDPAFKVPYSSGMRRPQRPAVSLIWSDAADVHVHPYHYVIYDRCSHHAWSGTNPQGLSRLLLWDPRVEHAGDVVILQDRFDGGNLAHFLFDAVTRLYHFCQQRPEQARSALFVFGGWPGEFHRLVLAPAARDLGLAATQFLFPRRGCNVRPSGAVCWFSDQADYMHPAQMMHPGSVKVLQRIRAAANFGGADTGRIYISRADAAHRRIANEAALLERMAKLRFQTVRLAELSALDQIRLVSNASCVVAPHGMGLTHLAFHRDQATVVELFSPVLGGDGYAQLSKAYKFDYHPVIGTRDDDATSHFRIDVDEVMGVLEACVPA